MPKKLLKRARVAYTIQVNKRINTHRVPGWFGGAVNRNSTISKRNDNQRIHGLLNQHNSQPKNKN